jgi:MFS family permease
MKNTEKGEGSAFYLAGVCLVASLGGLLFGFDTAVISGTVERVTGQFGLDDLKQGWFTSAALVGCLFGAAVAGWSTNALIGRRGLHGSTRPNDPKRTGRHVG